MFLCIDSNSFGNNKHKEKYLLEIKGKYIIIKNVLIHNYYFTVKMKYIFLQVEYIILNYGYITMNKIISPIG